jgi:hypothetical protein
MSKLLFIYFRNIPSFFLTLKFVSYGLIGEVSIVASLVTSLAKAFNIV